MKTLLRKDNDFLLTETDEEEQQARASGYLPARDLPAPGDAFNYTYHWRGQPIGLFGLKRAWVCAGVQPLRPRKGRNKGRDCLYKQWHRARQREQWLMKQQRIRDSAAVQHRLTAMRLKLADLESRLTQPDK